MLQIVASLMIVIMTIAIVL